MRKPSGSCAGTSAPPAHSNQLGKNMLLGQLRHCRQTLIKDVSTPELCAQPAAHRPLGRRESAPRGRCRTCSLRLPGKVLILRSWQGAHFRKLTLRLQRSCQLQYSIQALVPQAVAAPGPHSADVQGMVQGCTELDGLGGEVVQQLVGALQHVSSGLHTGDLPGADVDCSGLLCSYIQAPANFWSAGA